MFVGFVILEDQVVGLFIILNHRVIKLTVLCFQLMPRQVFHYASSQRISQYIGGCSETVPVKQQRRMTLGRFPTFPKTKKRKRGFVKY